MPSGAVHELPFHTADWLSDEATTQNVALEHDRNVGPPPDAVPSAAIGPVHFPPVCWKAWPSAVTAMQYVVDGHETVVR